MFDRNQYKKLAPYSRWYDGMTQLTPFLVGVVRPVELETTIDGVETVSGVKGHRKTPEFQFYKGVTPPNFKNFDNSLTIESWTIIRRCGPVEFTERQIWDAVMQHQAEFPGRVQTEETREQFQARDPIGYDETMAGMERVLYRALGYL